MKQIKLVKQLDWPLLCWSIGLGIILSYIIEFAPFIHRASSVFVVLILVNGAYSIYQGIKTANAKLGRWRLFVFPICYLIGAYLVLPKYTYYFGLVYLCVSYLSYAMTNENHKITKRS
ncbi:hypothetical protein LOOC260_111810 [Paucilactobacillus hokkaidonensis JCM 18461]|uniref:Uncharacterized protein n=2 Tax=Paucilactobacillus hokkaidonensis TaxID=1193095 RepID=A0A0A1GUS0_9LACO|nr:hypothetical protein [Paucilactobacillus hokkaidonensis]KRO10728.1 hypothetical protein IV59_GL001419 [Paucilactobacillus hokkaidonensis]BAP85720.1 hypothetical protein LOOC260_111810 [Paucilactobacillus hokkaidonensis JCM 18461]